MSTIRRWSRHDPMVADVMGGYDGPSHTWATGQGGAVQEGALR